MIHTFQLSQLRCRWTVFRSLFEKRVQENSVKKETCILKENEKRNDIKFRTFAEIATPEINAIWRMKYFSGIT